MSFNFIPDKKFSWIPLDSDQQIWTIQYYVPKFKSRTIAIRLKSGGCLIVSPGADLVQTFEKDLPILGQPKILLIPNCFHHYGVSAWLEFYPNAKSVASLQAMSRLHSKLGNRYSLESLNFLRAELPENIQILEPPGWRAGEVWLRVEIEKKIAWIVCDAFFNMPKLSPRFLTRLIQRMAKAAPGLSISRILKWVLIKNRSVYRKWVLNQLERDRPSILVPSHGDIIEDENLPRRIRQLVEKRF